MLIYFNGRNFHEKTEIFEKDLLEENFDKIVSSLRKQRVL